MRFEKKTAVVTGSARGIGKAIAERLGSQGAQVVISDILMEAAEKTVREFRDKGFEAFAIKADVSSSDDVKNLIKEAVAKYQTLDIVINNAGITRDTLMIRMSEDDWNKVIDINLKGAFLVTQAAAKVMMKQRFGRIVNISSVVGQMGNAGQANYSASKAGLIGLTKSSARELAARGITVNAIAPGFIESEMTEKLPEEVRNEFMKATALKRFGKPEDIAAAAAFLVSDDASYITGQVLAVNGGLLM
ncbi:MAG: 3-oxoacyl-ACP reductase [Candidatus Zixiibacteriota bacterium]|nr:MAG: 3-oxoacyl-ACP reductase [candidate division Zixibacteria bacterium]HHI02009.1 3-oxoacyl-[acyl-carrier-protein] reductase [candidate division Zixibacteria bacterium]